MSETMTLGFCDDCHLYLHGYSAEELGREPNSEAPEPLSRVDECDISAGLMLTEHEETCENRAAGEHLTDCSCEEPWFSWSPCQGCGSHLGGDRYPVTLWLKESA